MPINNWAKWKRERFAIVKHFREVRNKLEDEAVFEDDFKELKWYDRMLAMLGNLHYHFPSKKCPLCGKELLVKAHIDTCYFEGVSDKDLGQIEDADLIRCLSCGFTAIKE